MFSCLQRSEERRVGKGVDLSGRGRIIKIIKLIINRENIVYHKIIIITNKLNKRDNNLFKTLFLYKQKTAYEIGLGIPAEPLFRSKLLPILGTISGKTVKLMVLALICLGNNRQD